MAIELKVNDVVYATFSDDEVAIMNSKVCCAIEWLKEGPVNLLKGNVESSAKILDEKWALILAAENETVPADVAARRALIFAHPQYKDYATLKEEKELALLAQIAANQEST